ncbi:MAG: response regulator [Acidobacteriota bacterium]|nr:response regulator [Acidobacteriota bacterium]
MTYKLLIVDDEMPNLRLLERLFSRDFHCLTASSGADAIQILEQHDVAVLISDQRMPQMTGIELLKKTSLLRPHMVRILLTGYTDVEALVEALNSGLVYKYVTKPWNNDEIKLTVTRACEHYESNKKSYSLALTNGRLVARIKAITHGIAMSLAEMSRARDEYAYSHALRVRDCAMAIAKEMDLSEEEREELSCAALVHELGSLDTSSQSSADPTDAGLQTTIAQAHAECEVRLLTSIPELGNVAEIVKSYRENFDGSGSPMGLGATQIPLASRIVRVAHEYDSMILPKALVAPLEHDEAMRFLVQRSGKQFDPRIIEILFRLSHEELNAPLDANAVYGEDSRLKQDNFGPSYVDAVFS